MRVQVYVAQVTPLAPSSSAVGYLHSKSPAPRSYFAHITLTVGQDKLEFQFESKEDLKQFVTSIEAAMGDIKTAYADI